MSDRISRRVAAVPPSGIRKFFDIAATMQDVISLGIGEPDFVTPDVIRASGIASLNRGETSYTSNSGILELRQAITAKWAQLYGVVYDPEAGDTGDRRRLRGALPGADRDLEPRRRSHYPRALLCLLRSRSELRQRRPRAHRHLR